MNITEKIAIIPDTNYLYMDEKRKKDFSELSLNRYHKINKSFEFLEISGEIKIFIPELVLCELLSQYKRDLENEIRKYNKQKDRLRKFLPYRSNELHINVDEHLKKLKEKYFREVNIIKIPEDKTKLFNKIFKMAIYKEPPFIKEDESDKGFKDSILFLSLLEFGKNTEFDRYILISKDKGFIKNKDEILTKFSNYCMCRKDKLEIINPDQFESQFNEKYGLYEDLRTFIDSELIPKLLVNYNHNASITIRHDNFLIENCEFNINNTRIYQENSNTFEVELYFSVDLNFGGYHPDELYDMDMIKNITQREIYYIEKIEDKWHYKLCDCNYNINYEPWDDSLMNDEYP